MHCHLQILHTTVYQWMKIIWVRDGGHQWVGQQDKKSAPGSGSMYSLAS